MSKNPENQLFFFCWTGYIWVRKMPFSVVCDICLITECRWNVRDNISKMVNARHYHNKGSHIQKGNKRNASNLTYHRQLSFNKKFQQCKKIPFNNNKKVKSPLWRFTVSRLKKSKRERKICDGSVFFQVHNFDAQLSEEKPTFLISVRTFFSDAAKSI